jgi:hypothetical protein
MAQKKPPRKSHIIPIGISHDVINETMVDHGQPDDEHAHVSIGV